MSDIRNMSGVYSIVNFVNGKVYVGSAICLHERRRHHFDQLRNGCHPNRHLQSSYNKYGIKNFHFKVLEFCPVSELTNYEQKWIDKLNSTNQEVGYNICPKARSNLGLKLSEEARRKMSETRKGRKASEETRRRMSEAQKLRWSVVGRREVQSEKLKGYVRSKKDRKKYSRAIKKLWTDPEYRKMQKESLLKSWGETRDSRTKALQESWNDPTKRAKRLKKLRKTRRERRRARTTENVEKSDSD